MFSEDLKKKTLHVHQGVEKKLIFRIKSIYGKDEYIRLLELMYGFYAPLQENSNQFSQQLLSANTGVRLRNAVSILNDINDLGGGDANSIPVCNTVPGFVSFPAALGGWYVTEGSAIGGAIIARMISARLNIDNDKGLTFFNSYGKETESIWSSFKAVLNGPFTAGERDEILNAAMATFSTFNEWIGVYEPANAKL